MVYFSFYRITYKNQTILWGGLIFIWSQAKASHPKEVSGTGAVSPARQDGL
jgi:hypothetical protein